MVVRVTVAAIVLCLASLHASNVEGDSIVRIFTEPPFPGFSEMAISPALSAGLPFLNWSAGEVALAEQSVATHTPPWVSTDDSPDERATAMRGVLIFVTAILGIALAAVMVGFLTTGSPYRPDRRARPRTSSSILIR